MGAGKDIVRVAILAALLRFAKGRHFFSER
jgi:hypothetical protein